MRGKGTSPLLARPSLRCPLCQFLFWTTLGVCGEANGRGVNRSAIILTRPNLQQKASCLVLLVHGCGILS